MSRPLARPASYPWSRCARSALLLLVLGSLGSVSCEASAQPMGKTVVVGFGSADLTPALGVADAVSAQLSMSQVSVISVHDARDRFAARSRAPNVASESDVDVLAREARKAIEHVAFGRTAAAQRSVREVITRAERTLESLNRETATARQLLDACLSLVRSALHDDDRSAALEQARRCRRLVPDLAPSEVAHPANVVGALAEADDLLRRLHIGSLTVQSTPESACSVYLNGRHLGTTPFVLDRAAAGEYRVQVECGASAGRVHVVQLGDEPIELVVDSQLDRAVRSEPRLSLRYPDERLAGALAVSHAAQLGRAVQADDVVLVKVREHLVELLRVQVRQGRLVARATLRGSGWQGLGREQLATAIAALSAGRIEGEPSVALAVAVAPSAAHADTRHELAKPTSAASIPGPTRTAKPRLRPSRALRLRRLGSALVGMAGAIYVVGWGFELRAQAIDDELSGLASDDPNLEAKNSEFDLASGLRWLGVGAGGLAAVGTGLLVRPRSSVPWWSYGLGAAAVGLTALGVYEITAADQCQLRADGGCIRERSSAARGALLMSAATPLLSVPLTHLLSRPSGRSTRMALQLTPNCALMSLHIAH